MPLRGGGGAHLIVQVSLAMEKEEKIALCCLWVVANRRTGILTLILITFVMRSMYF